MNFIRKLFGDKSQIPPGRNEGPEGRWIISPTREKSTKSSNSLESLIRQSMLCSSFLPSLYKVAFCTLAMTPASIERHIREKRTELKDAETRAISAALKELLHPIGQTIEKEISLLIEWWHPSPTIVRVGTISTRLKDEWISSDNTKTYHWYKHSPHSFSYQALWQIEFPLTGNDEIDYAGHANSLLRPPGRLRLVFDHSNLHLQLYGGRFSSWDTAATIFTIPLERHSLRPHLTTTYVDTPQRRRFSGGSGSYTGNDWLFWNVDLIEYWLFKVQILEMDEVNKVALADFLDGPLVRQEYWFSTRSASIPPTVGQEGYLRITCAGEILWEAEATST